MRIALAATPTPHSIEEGLELLDEFVRDAARQQVQILCFPESFLPGYPGMGYGQNDQQPAVLKSALEKARELAADNKIALVLPMDWWMNNQFYNVAHVINANGSLQGLQTKNQLDPSEDHIWTPGSERRIFQIGELKFGIAICHEGFRYPEITRWYARQGAHLVFHPHFAGSNDGGYTPTRWLDPENAYYEKAMIMRSIENTIYFASVNYTTVYPESASAVINPDGSLLSRAEYAKAGVVIADLDLTRASAFLAQRLKPVSPASSHSI